MLPDAYFIPLSEKGRLAIFSRPRSGEWLEEEIKGFRLLGIDCLVSLLEPSAVHELGLAQEGELFEKADGIFYAYPVPDRSLPSDSENFQAFARDLAQQVKQGITVGVHCRAGIGRSGMLCCAVLYYLGVPIPNALELISNARGVKVPDTKAQQNWLYKELR